MNAGPMPMDRPEPSAGSRLLAAWRPVLAPAAVAAVGLAIFLVDTLTPYGFAVAVLYVAVVVLAANHCGRRGILFVAAACLGLTGLSYLLNHGASGDPEALLRCVMSLAAISVTTLLVKRNQAATAVLREQARLLDLAHDTVIVRDLQDVVTYWNRGAEELTGWPCDQALGRVAHELLRTVFPAPLPEIMAELLRTGRWEGELVHARRDGSLITMDSRWFLQRDRRGRPTAILEAGTDVTERKRAAAAALEHERQLKATIDGIPIQVWSSLPDGSIDFLNRQFEDNGFSSAALRSDWRMLVHPDDLARVLASRRAGRQHGRPFEAEVRMRRRDGSYRWQLHRLMPHRDGSGEVTKWYGVSIDIEDRKRAENALQRAQAELAHVTRMTTLGELAASMAHEVNQPLAGVVTHGEACLRWLDRETPRLDEVRGAVERMIGDGRRASEVIRKLRALAKRAELRPAPQALDEIIEDALPLVQRELASHRVWLKHERSAASPMVLADRVHLQQVFINLILNAIQAMDGVADGPRELVVRSARLDGEEEVRLEVEDSGGGIAPADAARLFEPFFTTKEEGMGMGLAISRSIVEAHGGRIWATGHDGPGATFHVALPAAPAAAR